MQANAYHTALKRGALANAEPCQRVTVGNSIAFQHDIMDAWPDEYAAADVLYSEIPWRAGFPVFERRAGVENPPTYQEFLQRINEIIATVDVPVVITGGQSMLTTLTKPDHVYDTRLEGNRCLLFAYGVPLRETETTTSAIAGLAGRFNTIGDFACGYGQTAIGAAAANKSFVVSDNNASCIGYIADHFGAR